MGSKVHCQHNTPGCCGESRLCSSCKVHTSCAKLAKAQEDYAAHDDEDDDEGFYAFCPPKNSRDA